MSLLMIFPISLGKRFHLQQLLAIVLKRAPIQAQFYALTRRHLPVLTKG